MRGRWPRRGAAASDRDEGKAVGDGHSAVARGAAAWGRWCLWARRFGHGSAIPKAVLQGGSSWYFPETMVVDRAIALPFFLKKGQT